MSLRFLSDQCVPAKVSLVLRHAGHEVVALRQVLHPRSPDALVIAKAQELGNILVSLNGDFSDIVTYPPENYQGIIAIQLHNHPEILDRLLERLTTYWTPTLIRRITVADYLLLRYIVFEFGNSPIPLR